MHCPKLNPSSALHLPNVPFSCFSRLRNQHCCLSGCRNPGVILISSSPSVPTFNLLCLSLEPLLASVLDILAHLSFLFLCLVIFHPGSNLPSSCSHPARKPSGRSSQVQGLVPLRNQGLQPHTGPQFLPCVFLRGLRETTPVYGYYRTRNSQ